MQVQACEMHALISPELFKYLERNLRPAPRFLTLFRCAGIVRLSRLLLGFSPSNLFARRAFVLVPSDIG